MLFLGHLKVKPQQREISSGHTFTPAQLPSVPRQFHPPVPPSPSYRVLTVDRREKPDEYENESFSPGKEIGYDDDDDDTGSDSEAASEKEEESKMTEEEVNKMQVAEEEKVRNYN